MEKAFLILAEEGVKSGTNLIIIIAFVALIITCYYLLKMYKYK